jgi:hypothetical protein
MKLAILLLVLTHTMIATAAVRYQLLTHICSNDAGMNIHLLAPGPANENDDKLDLKGKLMAYNKSNFGAPKFALWCSGVAKVSAQEISIKESERLAEDPSKCTFTLKTIRLTAVATFKQWDGYFGGLSRPVVNTTQELKCEVRNQIVNY